MNHGELWNQKVLSKKCDAWIYSEKRFQYILKSINSDQSNLANMLQDIFKTFKKD